MKQATIQNMREQLNHEYITMMDVANTANVSIATVSNVLNGTKPVSEKLKKKVFDAVSQLNYTPNYWAQSIKRKSGSTLGVIIPDIRNDFFSEVVRGVEDFAFQSGYSVMICNTENSAEKWNIYADMLYSKRFDGVIITGAWLQTREAREYLVSKGVPIAMVNFETDNDRIDVAGASRHQGGVKAGEYLISLGHTRIAVIEGRKAYQVPEAFDVIGGIEKALKHSGLELAGKAVCTDYSLECGYLAMQQIASMKQLPSAVFCENDLIALGAVRAAKDRGLSVPSDLSVIGFDDIEYAKYSVPSLTTIRVERYKLGQIAARMVVDRIRNPDAPKSRMVLAPEIIVRESTSAWKHS